jgi:hypothetical protein
MGRDGRASPPQSIRPAFLASRAARAYAGSNSASLERNMDLIRGFVREIEAVTAEKADAA